MQRACPRSPVPAAEGAGRRFELEPSGERAGAPAPRGRRVAGWALLCLLAGWPSAAVHAQDGLPKVVVLVDASRVLVRRMVPSLTEGLASGFSVTAVPRTRALRRNEAQRKYAETHQARFWIEIEGRASRRGRVVARAFETGSGEAIFARSQRSPSSREAPAFGRRLAEELAAALIAHLESQAPKPPIKPEEPPPKPEPKEPPPAPPAPAPAVVAAEPPAEPPSPRGSSPRFVRFEVGAGIGSQLQTAYAVEVGPEATGLHWRLAPLPLVQGHLGLRIGRRFSLRGEFYFSPASFSFATEPPVVPSDPGARFFDARLLARYAVLLKEERAVRWAITPGLGLLYDSLRFDPQTPTLLLNSRALTPVLGLEAMLGVRHFELIGEARFGMVVSYRETPVRTGGSGFGIHAGARLAGRYWLTSVFALEVGFGYDYARIGLSGPGDRVRFLGDPPLVDATVIQGRWRANAGAQFRF